MFLFLFIECPFRTFGVDCQNTCYCEFGPCDIYYGQCFFDDCLPGYMNTGGRCDISTYICRLIKISTFLGNFVGKHIANLSNDVGWHNLQR